MVISIGQIANWQISASLLKVIPSSDAESFSVLLYCPAVSVFMVAVIDGSILVV